MKPHSAYRLVRNGSRNLAIALVALLAANAASATSATWTGTTDAIWATLTNWSADPNPVPGTGDTASFNAAAGMGGAVIGLGSGVIIHSIVFDTSSVAAYTLGSGALNSQTLTLNNGGSITLNSTVANNELFNAGILLGTDATTQAYTFTNNSTTHTLTFAGNISGGTGGTAGTKTLTINGAGNTTIGGIIGNGGATAVALTKSGAGMLTLNGANTYTDATTVTGGTLTSSSNTTPFGSGAGGILLGDTTPGNSNNATLSYSGTSTTVAGAITVQAGSSGTLRILGLTNTNTFTGTIALNNNLTVNNDTSGKTTSFTGALTESSSALSISKLGGAGAVTFSTGATTIGTGGLTLNSAGGGVLTFAGGITSGAGTGSLTLNNNGFTANGITISTTSLNHTGSITNSGSGTGSVLISTGIGTNVTAIYQNSATSQLILSGANTYTGTTTVSAGVTNIQNATALGSTANGTSVTAGAALQMQTAITVGAEALTLNGTGIANDGALRNVDNSAKVWQGTVTLGSSGVRINSDANTLTFNTAANSITGTDTNLILGGAGNIAVNGTITIGSGQLFKDGAGTVTLTGANTYTGATTVSAGTLNVSGAAGVINASIGITLNGGNLTLANTTSAEGLLDRVKSDAAITSNAGTITYTNTSGNTLVYAETLGTVNLTAGQLNVVLTNNMAGTGNTQTLTLSGLTHTGARNMSAVAFASGTALNTTTHIIQVTGGGTTATGQIIAPWATAGSSATAQTDYAVYNSDRIVPAAIAASAETTWLTPANAYTLSGNTTLTGTRNMTGLRLTGGGATLTLAAGANLGTTGILNGGTGTLTINTGTGGAVTLPSTTAANLYVATGNNNITINAPIIDNGAGALTLVYSGSGTGRTLILANGANTYSGGTTVNNGTLQFNNSDANLGAVPSSFQADNLTLNNGVFRPQNINMTLPATRGITLGVGGGDFYLGWANVITINGAITGPGGLNKRDSGTLVLNAANDYTGTTTIAAGLIQIGNAGTTGSLSPLSAITNNATLRFNRTNTITQGTDFASVISGTGVVNQVGTGTLVFSGANTYTGATTVNAGSLQSGANDVLPNLSAVTVSGNAAGVTPTLALAGYSDVIASLTLGGSTNTSGAAVTTGAGKLTLNGDITYANANNPLGATISGNLGLGIANRSFTVNDSTTAVNDLTVGANISGGGVGLIKAGTGTLVLSGANTYTGTTTLNAGSLNAGVGEIASTSGPFGVPATAVGSIVFNGGTLQYTAANQYDYASRFTSTGNSPYNIDSNSQTVMFTTAVPASGSSGLTKLGLGTLVLSGTNAYTGATTVNLGKLKLLNPGTGLTQILSGALTLAGPDATLESDYNAGSGTLSTTFSSLTGRTAGNTANIASTGGTNGTDNLIRLTAGTAGFLDKGVFFNGADYAALHAAGPSYLRALAYGTDTNAEVADTITAGKHVKLTSLWTPANQDTITLLSLNLSNGGVNWTQNTSQTLTVPGIIKSGGGSVSTISGGTAVATGAELVIRTDTASDLLTISTPVSGNALTKSGAGTLTLSGVNTYNGTTTVNGGTLAIGGAGQLNSGNSVTVTLNSGGLFQYGSSANQILSGTVNGVGALTKTGLGTLTLSGGNVNYSGATTINQGVLRLTSTGTASAISVNTNGTLALNGANWAGNQRITLNGGTLITDESAGYVINNAVVMVSDNSILQTNGTGTTGNVSSYFLDGGLNIASTKVLTFNPSTVNNGIVLRGNASSGGSLVVSGVGTTSLTGRANVQFSTAGAINFANTDVTLTNATMNIGVCANNDGNTAGATLKSLSGNGRVYDDTSSNTLTVGANDGSGSFSGLLANGTATLSLLKTGAGTQVLSGPNTYTGTTTVNGGILRAGNATAFGPASNATLAFGSGSTGKVQLNGNSMTVVGMNTNATPGTPILESGSGTAGTDVLTVNNAAANTYAGVLQDGSTRLLGLTKSGGGTLTLSGTNTYMGGTTINSGSLLAATAASLPAGGNLTVNGGNFSMLNGAAAATYTANSLTLAGGASLTFDLVGTNTVDMLTSTNAATTSGGNIGISISGSATPVVNSPTTLIGSAGGGLLTGSTHYFVANNANYTATLAESATAVGITGYTGTVTALTNAYWLGDQVSVANGAPVDAKGVMALSYSTFSNWASDAAGTLASGVVPEGSVVNVIFGATGAAQQSTVTTGANMNLGSITFNDTAAVTLGGSNSLTLNSTSGTAASTSAALATVTAGSAISVTAYANALNTLNANIVLGASQTWNVASGKTLTVNGVVSGANSLTIGTSGNTGTVILAGANTYTGNTAINYGTVKVGGPSVAKVSGPFGNNSVVTMGNNVGATLDLNGYDTPMGSLAGGGANGGNLSLGANTLTVGGLNTNTQYSGVISGSTTGIALYKVGTGNLQLSRANTFTGKIVIDGGGNNGKLIVGDDNGTGGDAKLGSTPATFQADNITIKNGGHLVVYVYNDNSSNFSANRGIYLDTGTQYIDSGGGDFVINGVISGPGSLFHSNQGSWGWNGRRLYLGGANTFSGDIWWDASGTASNYGGVQMNAALALQNSALDANSIASWLGVSTTAGTLQLGGLVNGNRTLQDLTGNGTFTGLILNTYVAGVTKTYTNIIGTGNHAATTLTKTGLGTQALNGLNAYTGTTTINNGILSINTIKAVGGVANSLGQPLLANATIAIGDAATAATLMYTGTGDTTDRVINLAGTSGGATLDQSGTSGVLTLNGNITATTAGAKTLTLQGSTAGSGVIGGSLADSSLGATSLTKAGSGQWTLNGVNTYTGNTTLSAGTLTIGNLLALQNSPLNHTAGTLGFSAGINTPTFGGLTGSTSLSLASNVTALTLNPGTGVTHTYSGSLDSSTQAMTTLIKAGLGTQILSGPNAYTGATAVSQGKLYLNNSNATTAISVAGLATLGGTGSASSATATVANTGSVEAGYNGLGTLTLAGLTFGSASSDTASVKIANIGNYSSSAAINGGTLAVNGGAGTVTIALSGSVPASGTAHMIEYAGAIGGTGGAGFGAFAVDPSGLGIGPRGNFTLSNEVGYVKLTWNVDRPVWSGAGSGNWITSSDLITLEGTPTNWVLEADPFTNTNFIASDAPIFDGSATLTTVSISAADVAPASVTFDTSTKNYTLQGAYGITGGASLTKTPGGGTLTITTNNSYSGGTTISSGTLQVGNATPTGDLGSGTISNNGVLEFKRSNLLAMAQAISGSGSIIQNGAGELVLSGPNSYGGDTTLNAGKLTLGNATALGAATGKLIINGGTLDSSVASLVLTNDNAQTWNANFHFAGTNDLNLGAGAVALGSTAGTRTVTVDASTLRVGGILSNGTATALLKAGAGALVLGGVNLYSGGTTVNAGTLTVNDGATLGASSGPLTVNNPNSSGPGTAVVLNLNGSVPTGSLSGAIATPTEGTNTATIQIAPDKTLTVGQTTDGIYDGTIAGTNGKLVKNGGGMLTLSGTNTYTGGTQLNDGTLSVSSLSNLGTSGTILLNSGTFQYTGSDVVSSNRLLLRGGTETFDITQSAASLTLTREFESSTIIKKGAGTLALAGLVGWDTDSQGGLDLLVDEGTMVLNTSITNYLNITVNNVTDVKAGATLRLAISGSQIRNTNTFHMSGGTFDVNGYNAGQNWNVSQIPAIDGSGTITNSSANVGAIQFYCNGAKTFSGDIVDGAGSFTVNLNGGGNIWTLSGNNTYSGATTVGSGTLQAGSTTALSPNSAYTVTATLDLAGYNNTISGLQGAGTVKNGASSPTTLTVNNDMATSNADYTFSGLLRDGSVEEGGGVLSLTKTGDRALTLTGLANTYTGSTIVSGGALYLNGSNATTAISVAVAATLGGSGSAAAATATVANTGTVEAGYNGYGTLALGGLHIGASSSDTASVKLGNIDNYSSSPAVQVLNSGGLTINGGAGSVLLALSSSEVAPIPAAARTAHLIQYAGTIGGTGAGFGAFAVDATGLGMGLRGNVTLSNPAGFVDVTWFADRPVWTGAGSGNWITSSGLTPLEGTPTNWVLDSNPATQTNFIDSDAVVFNDAVGAGAKIVKISAGDVYPALVNFDNTTATTYTLQSAGGFGIMGNAALTKSANGRLIVTNENSYNGDTTISGGTLQVGNATTTGSLGYGNIANNGVLEVNRSNLLTLSQAISGTGSINQNGTGTLELSGINTYIGATNVSQGTLKLTDETSTNNIASSTLIHIASGALLDVSGLSGTHLELASGQTLKGNGTVTGGLVTAGTGAIVAPSVSAGALNFGSGLTLAAGSLFNWENNTLNTLGLAGTNWGKANVTGTTTIDSSATTGALLHLQFTNAGTDFTSGFWDSNRTWDFITGGVSTGFDLSNIAVFVAGTPTNTSAQGAFTTAAAGSDLQLVWTASLVVDNNSKLWVGSTEPGTSLATTNIPQAFGRVMVGSAQSADGIVLNSSGSDVSSTHATVVASGTGISTTTGSPGLISALTATGINATLDTTTSGLKSGAITIDNQAGTSAGLSQGSDNGNATVDVSGTVLADRIITASLVNLGTVHAGASVSGATTLGTTGGNNDRTAIQVSNVTSGGFSVTGGSSPVFDSGSVTDGRTLNATLNTPGVFTNVTALSLTPGTESGVSGTQTPVAVAVNYSANVYSGNMEWSGTSGNWSTNSNWTDSTSGGAQYAPGTDIGFTGVDHATFGAAGTNTVTVDAAANLNSLTFNGAGNYTLTGASSLTLAGAAAGITVTSGTQAIGAPLALANNAAVTVTAGTLAIGGKISGGGSATLTKGGGGILELSNSNNDYSGNTTVNGGTLRINGANTGAGSITVGALGTLEGSGSITGPLNVTGIVSPGGASLESLASGNLSLGSGSFFNYQVDSSVAHSVGADLEKVTGNLDLTSVVTLTLSDIALTPAAFAAGTTFSLINYTGTWNSGLFTLGTPLADDSAFTAGLNKWVINYNAADGGGNFAADYAGSTDSFVNITAAVANPGLDSDNDGVNNLGEFAFKGDANDPLKRGLFCVELKDNGDVDLLKELTYTCAVRRSATIDFTASGSTQTATIDGVVYTIEASLDLGAWTSTVSYVGKSDLPPAASAGLPSLAGTQWEYRTFSAFNGLGGKGFIHAKAVQP